jgi:hypothetical protein
LYKLAKAVLAKVAVDRMLKDFIVGSGFETTIIE